MPKLSKENSTALANRQNWLITDWPICLRLQSIGQSPIVELQHAENHKLFASGCRRNWIKFN
jgi:hypothetical protein